MNERFFKFARKASKRADYHGVSSPAIGGIAVYKGAIVASSWNTNKTSPLQAKYNCYRYNNPALPAKQHCETMLIHRLRWRFGADLDWSKVEIYLFREYKDGNLANSRPCNSCFHMLKDYGVQKVMYTSNFGYVEERLK